MTVAAILEAAAELICDLGYDRASTNRIAERAGVSIGSLYQYFPNKESILVLLLEEHHRSVHSVVDEALAELAKPEIPLAEGLRNLFTKLVELHEQDPKLTRALSAEVPHPAVGDHGDSEIANYARSVQGLLEGRSDVRIADLTVAAHLLVTTIAALSRWLVHDAPKTLDTAALIDEAVAMLAGYLCGNARQ